MTDKKKHILHTIENSTAGGAEAVLAYIASELNKGDYKSTVLLVHTDWLDKHLESLGVPYVVIPNDRPYDPAFVWKVTRFIRKNKIDLIHAHEFSMIVYGSVLARLNFIPMVGTIHGKNYYVEKKSRLRNFRLALNLSSRICSVSNDLRSFLEENLNIKNHKKLITMYNGIDLKKYDQIPDQFDRSSIGLSDDHIIGLSVGSLFDVKGFPYLLRATKLVVEKIPMFRLIIAGKGDQTALRELADNLGISQYVSFLGFRNDVPELLNMADLYLCSSLSEGLSLSILEAMAIGKPIVATSVGGNPELIDDGVNGYLVPSADPKALAEKMIELANDATACINFGKKARQKAHEQFSLETMITNYRNLFDSLIERR